MTFQEIVNEALKRLNVDPGPEETEGAMTSLNNNLSNFIYWKDMDLPGHPYGLDDESPFPGYYNEAFIVKLAVIESTKYPIQAKDLQTLLLHDKSNMERLHYREALGRTTKPGMTVI